VSSSAFSAIIEKYFYRNGGWVRLKGELAVYYWPRLAGAELAKKVEAVRFRDGLLYLQTESPALAHQILLMIPDILKKYHTVLGNKVLKGIKIKVGAVKISIPSEIIGQDVLLAQEEVAVIDECKREIADPELAAKFANFMQKSYINHKNKKANGGKACLSCGVVIDSVFNYCPCCEQKVNEEIKAFLKYQKKNNPERGQQDPSEYAGLRHLRMKHPN
jgi:Dna[CI] antecedent, DciA